MNPHLAFGHEVSPDSPPTPPLRLVNLSHSFERKTRRRAEIQKVQALKNIDVEFPKGTWTAIMGPSGSGKSTLLQCAAGLLRPSNGSVFLDGIDILQCSSKELTILRRDRIGFVFQSLNLVPALTAAQNVELPHRLKGKRPPKSLIEKALVRVGLEDRAHHRPDQLSGGQQQRVAIARAFALAPSIIFADEPTGALDQSSGAMIMDLFRSAVTESATVVMVTHDHDVAARADRVLNMVDGALISDQVLGF